MEFEKEFWRIRNKTLQIAREINYQFSPEQKEIITRGYIIDNK